MGGGKQPPAPAPPPAPPSPGETSAQAIQAQIDALPKQLEAQKEFGPQFSEEQLKSLQEFGPQFAQTALDLQKEFGSQFADVERDLAPELAGAQDTLVDFFAKDDEEEFASLRPGILEDVRGAQSARGIGDISPVGAIDEAVQLQRLKSSLKDRRLNIALSTAGRVPIGGVPQIQGQTGTGQLVQNVNPDSIFQAQNSINAFNANVFGSQANIFGTQSQAASQRGGFGSIIGTVAGGALGSFAGGAGAGIGASVGGKIGGRF